MFVKNWHRFGAVLLILIGGYLLLAKPAINQVQFLLILNLLALFAHQVEEYELPGGAPLIINRVVYNETNLADHYPGNSLSIMVVNVSAWFIYLIAIMLPSWHWLGLGVILFSLFQILGHVFQMNIKLKTWYNPGMFTTIVLFLPLGIVFIHQLAQMNALNWSTWLFSVLTLLGCIITSIILPVQSMKNKDTKYVISPWQVNRYHQVVNFCKIKK
ncbi:HXXEE domain-containing protein [Lactobacillus sp. Sy-1]|uniref:HXXEE domain-containing protein n=1 Tax=Lactobacillus sp. Sy-1 TaxID=2109645 RepID=UPI001C56C556|nr:HXXEE domain-containing protein [Lactobacillus sp. Sy-1]MBW1605201.1 HXXEE domain-containing protein [Lactobacillus sp. Sy-1]